MPPQRPSTPIPNPVRKVIADHIVSVEQLEIVLLLQRHRDRWWTIDEVNQRLQTNPNSIKHRLGLLTESGLLKRGQAGFRYEPPEELEVALTDLARLYANRRHAVIELIFARPDR